ncbi:MAG: hypothetical protein JXQ71_14210, partial [Verrucomicrobia bacterium]|nr:hypothetical protein [Verrucomicrobiota bacterium]
HPRASPSQPTYLTRQPRQIKSELRQPECACAAWAVCGRIGAARLSFDNGAQDGLVSPGSNAAEYGEGVGSEDATPAPGSWTLHEGGAAEAVALEGAQAHGRNVNGESPASRPDCKLKLGRIAPDFPPPTADGCYDLGLA